MKRSEINAAIADAQLAFDRHHWHLPPNPKWDVTGFGLGKFNDFGLVLVNLANLPQYCEKLLFSRQNQLTILHCHKKKQEDIIARAGTFAMRLAARNDDWTPNRNGGPLRVLINGEQTEVNSNTAVYLKPGERITLFPGVYHEFWAMSDYAIIGEVSTANDDESDNFFERKDVGRFEQIDEDEPAIIKLVSDK